MTTADVTVDLERRLRARYPAPAYAYLPQVGDSTGATVHRHADAVVMGLWPSRGLHLMGFEIKAARGDWLRELRDPRKAEEIAAFCDQWWMVAPADVILPRRKRPSPVQAGLAGIGDEAQDGLSDDHLDLATFPERWGLLVPRGKDGLRALKPAQTLEARALDRAFLAAILRRAAEHVVPRSSIEAELRAAWDRGQEHGLEQARREGSWRAEEGQRLRDSVAQFEAVSGVRIEAYRGRRIGEAVALLLRWQQEGRLLASRVKSTRDSLADLIEHIDNALASGVLAGAEEAPSPGEDSVWAPGR